jgi:hypothetical protein
MRCSEGSFHRLKLVLAVSVIAGAAAGLVVSGLREVPVAVVLVLVAEAFVVAVRRPAPLVATVVLASVPYLALTFPSLWQGGGGAPTSAGESLWVLIAVACTGASWSVGMAQRGSRERASKLRALLAQLESEGDTHAQLAVIRARTSLAGELNDAVAQAITGMRFQAAVAKQAIDGESQRARHALRAVQATGRAIIADLQGLLRLLRSSPERQDDRAVAAALAAVLPSDRGIARLRLRALDEKLEKTLVSLISHHDADWLLGAAALAAGASEIATDYASSRRPLLLALLPVLTMPLVMRRRHPVAVLWIICAAVAVVGDLGLRLPVWTIAGCVLIVAGYSVGAQTTGPRPIIAAVAGPTLLAAIHAIVHEPHLNPALLSVWG